MRRLAVLFSVLCLTAAATGVLTSAPAGAAPGETTIYLANAFSFAGGHPFGGTFCIDGAIVGNAATEEVTGPVTIASGDHLAQFFDSSVGDCTSTANGSFDGTFPASSVTLMAYWGDAGQALALLDNPLDCVAAGAGRLTVRNGSGFGDPSDVDIYGDGPGGTGQLLLSGIESGDQGTVDLPVGSYTNVVAVASGGTPPDDTVVDLGSINVVANSGAYAYLYGGNDGDVGSFLGNPAELNACAVATTLAPTTTAPPAAAAAVQATPAFTG